MNKSNKFNTSWQIIRVQARKLKDIDVKIDHVITFLDENENIHNYGRVMNWLKMTQMGYRVGKGAFHTAMVYVETNKSLGHYESEEDSDDDFSNFTYEDLLAIKKDLDKRKYGFMMSGKVPKAHTAYIERLNKYLLEWITEH